MDQHWMAEPSQPSKPNGLHWHDGADRKLIASFQCDPSLVEHESDFYVAGYIAQW
jgi:hypothetical protein